MTEVQGKQAVRPVLLASLWLTLLVLTVKVWVGLATQSLSLVSESLYTLIGSFSILLSILASTSRYTIGRDTCVHGRAETVMALLLVAFMGFSCCSLLAMSVHQLRAIASSRDVLSVQVNPSLLQLFGVIIATSFCLSCFERYEAGVLQNYALRFNANYRSQDVWLMLIVLGGWVGNAYGYSWLDPLLAILMIGVAIVSCWRIFNRQLPFLMRQTAIAPEALAQTIHQVDGITHCYGIDSHGVVGRQIFVELHLILHPECHSIARTIAHRVERAIRERYGPAQVVIYIESNCAVPGR